MQVSNGKKLMPTVQRVYFLCSFIYHCGNITIVRLIKVLRTTGHSHLQIDSVYKLKLEKKFYKGAIYGT